MTARNAEPLNDYARELIAALKARIPVAELAECAFRNLTAKRRVRMSKDDPDGILEDDAASQLKALAFVAEQTGGKAGQRQIPPPAKEIRGTYNGRLRAQEVDKTVETWQHSVFSS